jgi:hypothetical protein
MEEEQRSNAEAFASTANTTYADAACYGEEILQGLLDALNREDEENRSQLSPEMRDKLLEESFPKIHPEDGNAKELTMDEYFALRTGLQEVIQSDMKEKMALLQDQLSEYHSVLEDMIAFKSRCELLEQEKKDLATVYRQACQVRDDKIALLEKEVARLRNEPRHRCSVSSCNSTDGASSLIGSDSDGQYVLGHDHLQEDYHDHPQQIQAPALTSRTPKMCYHHYHHYKVAARMISSSPSSVPYHRSSDSSDDFCVATMQEPLPLFQESSAPVLLEMMNQQQQGGFDGNSYLPRSGENRSTKRHKLVETLLFFDVRVRCSALE